MCFLPRPPRTGRFSFRRRAGRDPSARAHLSLRMSRQLQRELAQALPPSRQTRHSPPQAHSDTRTVTLRQWLAPTEFLYSKIESETLARFLGRQGIENPEWED